MFGKDQTPTQGASRGSGGGARQGIGSSSGESMILGRRLPVGAELVPGGVHFRVWAPLAQRVEVLEHGGKRAWDLQAEGRVSDPPAPSPQRGYHSGFIPGLRAGFLYRYRLDGGDAYPDPAARFQPEGPFGPSEVIDSSAFVWTDQRFPGLELPAQVLYELHLGTFSREGSCRAAAEKLEGLKELGITALCLMPVGDFPGRFGWGYDGVNLFAPSRLYGRPDELRHFVNSAHDLGLGVILDVVYNHLGPSGNFLHPFSDHYFSDRYENEWGEPFNFDGEHSAAVRELIVANAGYWIDEFHLDGLRLDATQAMFDSSKRHIIPELAEHCRSKAGGRKLLLIGENEPQNSALLRPESEGGLGLDALWNDDFHHATKVALTGSREAYYLDYLGSPQEFISLAKFGFLYQGQHYRWQNKARGSSTRGLLAPSFVSYLQNHDQVANSAQGRRIHQISSPGRFRALSTYWLLGPWTPMFFMGQEYAANTPFTYFAEHEPELAKKVLRGRKAFLHQFPRIAAEDDAWPIPNPADPQTFYSSKLDWQELEQGKEIFLLHRELLALRRGDPAFAQQDFSAVEGAVLCRECFVLRFFCDKGDRLLLVNLGRERSFDVLPEPLLAPPGPEGWSLLFSSESPRFGGRGTPPVTREAGLWLPPECAVVLRPGDLGGSTAKTPTPGCTSSDLPTSESLRAEALTPDSATPDATTPDPAGPNSATPDSTTPDPATSEALTPDPSTRDSALAKAQAGHPPESKQK